jgi:hypothetical protein
VPVGRVALPLARPLPGLAALLPREGATWDPAIKERLLASGHQQFSVTFQGSRPMVTAQLWSTEHLTEGATESGVVEEEAVAWQAVGWWQDQLQEGVRGLGRRLPAVLQTWLRTAAQAATHWVLDCQAFWPPSGYVSSLQAMHPRLNWRVKWRVFEFTFPVLEQADGGLDFSLVQRAVWDALDIAERLKWVPPPPQPATPRAEGCDALSDHLDVRLVGSSPLLLSHTPERPGVWGWAKVGLGANAWTLEPEWARLRAEVVGAWAGYTLPGGGLLLPRPHWAKEMPPWVGPDRLLDYLRRAYRCCLSFCTAGLQEAKFRSWL